MAVFNGMIVLFYVWLCFCNVLARPQNVSGSVIPIKNLDSADVQAAISFAREEVNLTSDRDYKLQYEGVDEAREQVVGGMKYYFRLLMLQTDCKKDGSNSHSCGVVKDRIPIVTCDVEVVSRQWENYMKLTNLDCIPEAPYLDS